MDLPRSDQHRAAPATAHVVHPSGARATCHMGRVPATRFPASPAGTMGGGCLSSSCRTGITDEQLAADIEGGWGGDKEGE